MSWSSPSTRHLLLAVEGYFALCIRREQSRIRRETRVVVKGEERDHHRYRKQLPPDSLAARIRSTAIICRKHWSPCCRSTCQYGRAAAPSWTRRTRGVDKWSLKVLIVKLTYRRDALSYVHPSVCFAPVEETCLKFAGKILSTKFTHHAMNLRIYNDRPIFFSPLPMHIYLLALYIYILCDFIYSFNIIISSFMIAPSSRFTYYLR